jgi:hypothetical protein
MHRHQALEGWAKVLYILPEGFVHQTLLKLDDSAAGVTASPLNRVQK